MTFESLDILDWYDGPVIALARLPNRTSLYLASLIAWSIEERRRAFALIEFTDTDVATIRAVRTTIGSAKSPRHERSSIDTEAKRSSSASIATTRSSANSACRSTRFAHI